MDKLNSQNFAELSIAARAIREDMDKNHVPPDVIGKKYKRIADTYPTYFDMIVKDPNCGDVLTVMANLVYKREQGEITKERADVELGEFMAQKYIPQYRDHLKRGQDRLAQG
tara:strand:- start:968 stop:1303 length:336 start_codon:yes stop_codon:yes gene_type:complete